MSAIALGTALAALAAVAFGVTTPIVQRFGQALQAYERFPSLEGRWVVCPAPRAHPEKWAENGPK